MNQPDPDLLATGLIRVDASHQVSWINRAAADLFGRSRSALVRLPLAQLSVALDDWHQRMDHLGQPLQVSEAQLAEGGSVLDVIFHRLENDTLIELHPVTDRIRQRAMAERADRQQALTLLTRRLAHELRNPLAGVRGAAQLIQAATGESRLIRHAQMIQREVDRITGLIERFAGDGEKQLEAVNLHQVLDEAGELVLAENHGHLKLKKHYDPSIPELQSNGGQLHQLFLNLLRNSIQAGAREIRMTTRIEHRSLLIDEPARHAVRIDIDDDGQGVPEALRDRLFLPLVTGRDQGSGFGLAVAQQIARMHRGLIEFEPLERGSRFRVRLPLIVAKLPSIVHV